MVEHSAICRPSSQPPIRSPCSPTSRRTASWWLGAPTTFIFFGVALVVGAWLARRIAKDRRMLERVATIGVATVCFLGSLLYGGGPLASLLPGPYRVGADELSLGSPSLAVAHWADANLPAGSHVAVDRDNGALLNAIGGVDPVTAEAGLVNPAPLFFDHRLSPFDISLIREADIRYIVVDDRLAQGLPLYGIYIADGEPHGSSHPGRAQQIRLVSRDQAHLRQRSDPGVRPVRGFSRSPLKRHLRARRWEGRVLTWASSFWPCWSRCCGC